MQHCDAFDGNDQAACDRLHAQLDQTLDLFGEMQRCGYESNSNACDQVDQTVGCGDGATAECAGHLTALAIQVAATHRIAEAVAGDSADAANLCSFTSATPVLMADGKTKPIGKITTDDRVEAADPKTGKITSEPVTKLHDNIDTDLADLTVATTNHSTQQSTRPRTIPSGTLRPAGGPALTNSTSEITSCRPPARTYA